MSFAERFEDLRIWQEAWRLCNAVYNGVKTLRDFEFRGQMTGAALSVMNNIAEVFERKTKRDFAHFLDQAKESAGEVRSMLYLGEDRGYFAKDSAESLRQEYLALAGSIGALSARLPRMASGE